MMQLEELSELHLESLLALVGDFFRGDPVSAKILFGAREFNEKSAKIFIQTCQNERLDWRPKAGKLSLTHYVLLDNGEICGYGRLRFPIDADGNTGNLEFFVPPTRRRQGYGTHTLNRLLFEAVRAGLARALVVCQSNNLAAIRCIEHNRGEKIDESDGEWSRFWLRFR